MKPLSIHRICPSSPLTKPRPESMTQPIDNQQRSDEPTRGPGIPSKYRAMHRDYPELMQAYESLGQQTRLAGPLSDREAALVKLAISVGAGLEGAAHSHCRKALSAGCSADDLRHVALLATPTIGFPPMMRAKGWVEDVVDRDGDRSGP